MFRNGRLINKKFIIRIGFSRNISNFQVFISGIQATGTPHIGNYLGFMQNWVNYQKVNFFLN